MRRYHGPDRTLVADWLAAIALSLILVGCSSEAPLPGDPLRIAASTPTPAVVGEPYRFAFSASGGIRPYTFRIDDGELPPGLTLQGGLLVGTPTRLGTYAFFLAVSDGSLASTFQRYVLTVRDVAVPVVTLDVPRTEVRDDVTLRLRVAEADRLRAVRVRLRWSDPSVTPAEEAVRELRSDTALFWQAEDGALAIDLAFLGDTFDGEAELFRIDFDVAEATRLGFDFEVETLYSDRHAYASDRLGVPPTTRAPEATTDTSANTATEGETP